MIISSYVLQYTKLHIYEPVSLMLSNFYVERFQVLIHLSAVPPPVLKTPIRFLDQSNALTAALCVFLNIGKLI